ncbi:MAG: hypothetical protein AVDCRST_MAG61-882, partial [uncultured Friedmanniella sp.]
ARRHAAAGGSGDRSPFRDPALRSILHRKRVHGRGHPGAHRAAVVPPLPRVPLRRSARGRRTQRLAFGDSLRGWGRRLDHEAREHRPGLGISSIRRQRPAPPGSRAHEQCRLHRADAPRRCDACRGRDGDPQARRPTTVAGLAGGRRSAAPAGKRDVPQRRLRPGFPAVPALDAARQRGADAAAECWAFSGQWHLSPRDGV